MMNSIDVWKAMRPSALSSWEPMMRDWESLFKNMQSTDGFLREFSRNGMDFVPACDIEETEKEYHLTMDVPGVEKDHIRVEVVGHSVHVSGERKSEREEKGTNSYRHERSFGKFDRTYSLPEDIKAEEIEATYENGVLCLTLPKSKKSKSKVINVKGGKSGQDTKISGKNKKSAK